MEPISIKDNTTRPTVNLTEGQLADLEAMAKPTIGDLAASDGVLVFPPDIADSKDKIGNQHILSIGEREMCAGNIMGFVGRGDTRLRICSRFAQNDREDFFLHYMLQRVLAVNLFSLDYNTAHDEVFDFLLYLFPRFLKDALRQGLYKEYQRRSYNDSHVRGPINVGRHLRQDTPFAGRVAYDTREYSHDNAVTQLVRHTIEHIAHHPYGHAILSVGEATREAVATIRMATPTYQERDRRRIVHRNLRPVAHPFFTAYRPLQRLCLQILRHEELKYGHQPDEIHGILFDGAWLWEEYLNTVLKPQGFKHPENKRGKGALHAFTDNTQRFFPDFYHEAEGMVLDAKYKRYGDWASIQREDLYQVISYMYLLKVSKGGFVFPVEAQGFIPQAKTLKGYGGAITTYGLGVSHPSNSFAAYCAKMNEAEQTLGKWIAG